MDAVMYDNLTVNDIVDVWSRVHLDNAIECAAWENRRRPEPPPPPFYLAVRLALQMENELKKPIRLISPY